MKLSFKSEVVTVTFMDNQIHCTTEGEIDVVIAYYCEHGYQNNLGNRYRFLPDSWIQTWPEARSFTHNPAHYDHNYSGFDGEFCDWCEYVGIDIPSTISVDVSGYL